MTTATTTSTERLVDLVNAGCPTCPDHDGCFAVRFCEGCDQDVCTGCWDEHNKDMPANDHTSAARPEDREPTQEQQPTPRPWVVDEDSAIYYVVAPEIALVATLDPSDDDAPAEANAALIVRAVNAHDSLVEALGELLDCETNLAGCSGVKLLDAVDKAREALKLAEA